MGYISNNNLPDAKIRGLYADIELFVITIAIGISAIVYWRHFLFQTFQDRFKIKYCIQDIINFEMF